MVRVGHHVSSIKKEASKQTLTLATSGFGLVAALAWNELIKELVEGYIQPLVGGSSGIISKLIYAVLVTILAVLVTYGVLPALKSRVSSKGGRHISVRFIPDFGVFSNAAITLQGL